VRLTVFAYVQKAKPSASGTRSDEGPRLKLVLPSALTSTPVEDENSPYVGLLRVEPV
jgi:hypothetical protein